MLSWQVAHKEKSVDCLCRKAAEVDRLHVKRNRIVGLNYLGIIDVNFFQRNNQQKN